MTISLPPYSGENSHCAKCGSTSARTRYQARLDPSARIQHEIRNVPVADPEQERLCRDCDRCHFHWDEATVDAEKPAGDGFCMSRYQAADGVEPCMLDRYHMGYHRGVTCKWTDQFALPERPSAGSCSVAAEETVPNNQGWEPGASP